MDVQGGHGKSDHAGKAFAVDGAAPSKCTFPGRIMTGLLVAGGSGAIFNMFAKMGLRNPTQLAKKARKAREETMAVKQQQTPAAGEPPS